MEAGGVEARRTVASTESNENAPELTSIKISTLEGDIDTVAVGPLPEARSFLGPSVVSSPPGVLFRVGFSVAAVASVVPSVSSALFCGCASELSL